MGEGASVGHPALLLCGEQGPLISCIFHILCNTVCPHLTGQHAAILFLRCPCALLVFPFPVNAGRLICDHRSVQVLFPGSWEVFVLLSSGQTGPSP